MGKTGGGTVVPQKMSFFSQKDVVLSFVKSLTLLVYLKYKLFVDKSCK